MSHWCASLTQSGSALCTCALVLSSYLVLVVDLLHLCLEHLVDVVQALGAQSVHGQNLIRFAGVQRVQGTQVAQMSA